MEAIEQVVHVSCWPYWALRLARGSCNSLTACSLPARKDSFSEINTTADGLQVGTQLPPPPAVASDLPATTLFIDQPVPWQVAVTVKP
jgi:hypothetical protein